MRFKCARLAVAGFRAGIVEAIANGSAPADITVSSLARALPHGWAAQEHKVGIT